MRRCFVERSVVACVVLMAHASIPALIGGLVHAVNTAQSCGFWRPGAGEPAQARGCGYSRLTATTGRGSGGVDSPHRTRDQSVDESPADAGVPESESSCPRG